MRQLVRHRTANLNEYSGRYSEMSNEFYLPQGDYLQNNPRQTTKEEVKITQRRAPFNLNSIEFMIPPQIPKSIGRRPPKGKLSRIVLPVSNYTECIWKVDLHNFFHFVRLRSDSHLKERYEIIRINNELVKPKFPICCDPFEDYVRDSVTFSKSEMEFIRDCVVGDLIEEYKIY